MPKKIDLRLNLFAVQYGFLCGDDGPRANRNRVDIVESLDRVRGVVHRLMGQFGWSRCDRGWMGHSIY